MDVDVRGEKRRGKKNYYLYLTKVDASGII
jgi:hypothetical protein